MKHKLLIVDDDLKNIKAVKGYLEKCGYEISVCQNITQAFDTLVKDEFALVLLDYHMPETKGGRGGFDDQRKIP